MKFRSSWQNLYWSFNSLLNLSFITDVFPSVLKTAKVVPVFKKLGYSNYHPISLLSNIDKILEKLIYKRLYYWEYMISSSWWKYRLWSFCGHGSIAFDTVDHQILLAKLNHYGIRGVSKDWFKSCLSNRSQYVS